MDKKMNNEELQSRREFFKKAAKAALPIITATVLLSAPNVATASEVASGCRAGTCTGYCYFTCQGTCDKYCQGGCKGSSKRIY